MRPMVQVEVWSDVVCPWCYIGKRRFETALATLEGEIDVTVAYRAYQLDPTAPAATSMSAIEAYSRKFGGPERAAQIIDQITATAATVGLDFHLDIARRANTLLAHRLIWLAGGVGVQAQMKERLLRAYFTDGLDVGDPDVLAACAADVGLDADRVAAFLAGDDGTAEVRAQMAFAADNEITAVPTYVLDGQWSIPGAQEPETFVAMIRRLVAKRSEQD